MNGFNAAIMGMTAPNYLTADQVAEKRQLNADVVRRMLAADKLPGKRVGRVWRTSAAAFREFIEDGNETKSTIEPRNFQRDGFEFTIEFSCYALGSTTISVKEKRIERVQKQGRHRTAARFSSRRQWARQRLRYPDSH